MLDILHAQEFRNGIPARLPRAVRVAHKTGDISTIAHDAGVVYPEGRKPYVIAVLTEWAPDAAGRSADDRRGVARRLRAAHGAGGTAPWVRRNRFPLTIVDGLRLDKSLRDVLLPGRIVYDGDGNARRLPRYFYEIPSWEHAMSVAAVDQLRALGIHSDRRARGRVASRISALRAVRDHAARRVASSGFARRPGRSCTSRRTAGIDRRGTHSARMRRRTAGEPR